MSTTTLQADHVRNGQHIVSAVMGSRLNTAVDAGAGGGDRDRDVQLERSVRHAAYLRRGFYLVVLLVALAGQVSGATESLRLRPLAAIPAVAALELGGMVVLSNADVRRQLGERAIGSRILSAAIAAGAVWFNAAAHHDHLVGGFFAGMSALGYLVWLTHSENTRRDRLRAAGDLPPTTPAYELIGHWLRHPFLTQRAKSLAKADPILGLYGSITAATRQREREHRRDAIAAILHRKIRAAVDPDTAALAVAVYDLDEIARQLAASADYTSLTDLIATDLQPNRLTKSRTPNARAATRPDPKSAPPRANMPGEPAGLCEPTPRAPHTPAEGSPSEAASIACTTATRSARSVTTTNSSAASSTDVSLATADVSRPDAANRTTAHNGDVGRPGNNDNPVKTLTSVPPKTAAAVAYWLEQDPSLHPAQIGERIGRSERTVRRYLPPRPKAEPVRADATLCVSMSPQKSLRLQH